MSIFSKFQAPKHGKKETSNAGVNAGSKKAQYEAQKSDGVREWLAEHIRILLADVENPRGRAGETARDDLNFQIQAMEKTPGCEELLADTKAKLAEIDKKKAATGPITLEQSPC